MYRKNDFRQVGTVPEGELVLKLPGTDFKLKYEGGKGYVNRNNTVGQLSLAIRDFETAEVGEADGPIGLLGREMAEQLKDDEVKAQVKQLLAGQDHHLFYSRAEDGTEIVCLPGMGKTDIDATHIPCVVVASYTSQECIPDAAEVYALHLSAVGDRVLVSDAATLEKAVLELVPKANGVYEKVLEVFKELGF